MIAHGARAPRGIDFRRNFIAHRQRARGQLAVMAEHIRLNFQCVAHHKRALCRIELTRITRLAARLRVKRRAIQHHDTRFTTGNRRHRRAFTINRHHLRIIDIQRVVALEHGFRTGIFDGGAHLKLRCRARGFALALHGRLVAGVIHAHIALARDVGGQVNRKAKGVVQLEHGIAVKHVVFARQCAFEDFHAVFERFGKAFFFLLQHARDTRAHRSQFGIRLAHRLDQISHEVMQERFLLSQLVAVTNRAADDAPEHVAAAFVAGNHAIDNHE